MVKRRRDKKLPWEIIDPKVLANIPPEVAIEIAHMPKRERELFFDTLSYVSLIKEHPELALPLFLLRTSKRKR